MNAKREAPELATSGLSPTKGDDRFILGGNSDVYFLEEDAAVVVAQFANSHKDVMELRHYVAALDNEIREEQVFMDAITWQAEGLILAQGERGVMYKSLAPESEMAMSELGNEGGERGGVGYS